jgi:hypothetical protein
VCLESADEKYTMHVTGGDLFDKILTVSLRGTSKNPSVRPTANS